MSTPYSATNPLDTEQLMRTLLLDTQRQAEELSLLEQVRSSLARETELETRTLVVSVDDSQAATRISPASP